MKKKYVSPKLKAVELDCKQAMLQVCKAGGGYFWTSPIGWCIQTGTSMSCPVGGKAGGGLIENEQGEYQGVPS
ncbi:MAG: hypothetical protein PHQ52_00970 [Candidatus Omnitrophica bacterium]|nr:hypothetical protein [Candidatus Omnitrophota bacterium]